MWENPEKEEKSEKRSLQPCAGVDMRRIGFLVSKLLTLGSDPCASQDGLFKRQTSLATLYPGTALPRWSLVWWEQYVHWDWMD